MKTMRSKESLIMASFLQQNAHFLWLSDDLGYCLKMFHLSKNQIHLKLARKAEKVDSHGKKRLAVFDGAGCNRTVLPYFHKSPAWAGFACKFPRIRNIELDTGIIHIRKYLSHLTQDDFEETKVAGKTV